jgi:short-subunit dehydrogenase
MSQLPTHGRVMVTGASSGIGSAYATKLAKRGYALCLVARRKERLDALAQKLSSEFGAEVEVQVADLENPDHLAELGSRLAGEAFTGLVNNAGAGGLGPITASTAQTLERNLRLNIVALALLSRAVLAGFKAQDAGFLINIGSILALAPSPAAAAYSGSKAFVLNFTRSLQLEFSASAIRIQLVMPGPVRTEFFSAQGMDGSVFPEASYLTADQLVGAAMTGLDRGETITIPSLPNIEVWEKIESLRTDFMAATLSGAVADRYPQ